MDSLSISLISGSCLRVDTELSMHAIGCFFDTVYIVVVVARL